MRHHSLTPFAFATASIVLWVVLAGLVNSAQFPDSIEQFVWAQSFEWGYWKHPPLLTWLLASAIHVFGFWTGWTYALAALCFTGTAFLTWRIAHMLLGPQVAMVALLLLSLHQGFAARAQMYNHNSLLLLVVALTVWATLVALENKRRACWLLVGLSAGLAMLTKYQALVPLVGIVIALHLSGQLRAAEVRQGLLVAGMVALAVFTPHLLFLADTQFSTLRYAAHAAVSLDVLTRVTTLFGYWVNQLRVHIPMLVAIALFALSNKPGSAKRVHQQHPQAKAWLLGLVAWPLVALALVSLLGGVRLQAAWGLQSFQFLVLLIAWRLVKSFPAINLAGFLPFVLVAQLLSLCIALWSWMTPLHFMQSTADRNYPAGTLTAAVMKDWHSATACPLHYVVGPSFEAGLVSIHSGTYPQVLEADDASKSPWVDKARMQTLGAVYLAVDPSALPPNLVFKNSMPAQRNRKADQGMVYWGIAAPQPRCQ